MKQLDINSVSDYIAAIEKLKTYYPVGMILDSLVAEDGQLCRSQGSRYNPVLTAVECIGCM